LNNQLDPNSTNILTAANSTILWLAVVGVFGVIIIQSVIYFRAARLAAPSVGMSKAETITAFRAGAVASFGPSLAVSLIAITLVPVFGTPGVLTRIGLIGSVAFDVAAAGIVSQTEKATLGGAGYTQAVFANVLLCIAIAGAGWMVVTLVATPLLKRGSSKLEAATTGAGAAAMAIIPVAALLGVFSAFGVQQFQKGMAASIVTLTSGATMGVCLWIAKHFKQRWLKEWALGIALIVGLVVGVLVRNAGIK